jgi:hypothetical protein
MENEHEHTHTNGHAAPPPPPPGPATPNAEQFSAFGKSLFGGGPAPEWLKWALGAAALGAALGVLYGGSPAEGVPVATATGPSPTPTSGPRVVERKMSARQRAREYPLGFFQSGIRAEAGAIDVISRPQINFLGNRLIIPSDIAPFFSLIDVKVGNRSQLANSTALPARVFQEDSSGVVLSLDPAVAAQDIALVVENITSDAQTFMAALIGTAAQPCEVCGGYGRTLESDA